MIFRVIAAVDSQNRAELASILCGQNAQYLKP